jgi:hypothetical protein
MKTITAYKLFRLRKDGSLGSLFMDARRKLPVGKWMWAEDHLKDGFAHRPGWHAMTQKKAPHLSKKDRVWCKVEIVYFTKHQRPRAQGGMWYLARRMKIVEKLVA